MHPLSPFHDGLVSQVSETEREDLEESEKIQYWVERLCQTRLEQISSAENEIPEVTHLPSMGTTMAFTKAHLGDHRVGKVPLPQACYRGVSVSLN